MSDATARMADTLLRASGGRSVLLRLPQPAVAGDAGEQLGEATPGFQDMPLGPVTFRHNAPKPGADGMEYQLLVSASAVTQLVGSLAYDSADVLFRSAAGVLVDEDLLRIESAVSLQRGGAAYMYLLRLRGALALLL